MLGRYICNSLPPGTHYEGLEHHIDCIVISRPSQAVTSALHSDPGPRGMGAADHLARPWGVYRVDVMLQAVQGIQKSSIY